VNPKVVSADGGFSGPQCARCGQWSLSALGKAGCQRNLGLLGGPLDDESLESAVPQFIAECIRLQTFWFVSVAKQDGTHSVLNAGHDYKVIQADSLFNDLGALIFALEIGVATNASKLATQDM
jgi:hypothetical protein